MYSTSTYKHTVRHSNALDAQFREYEPEMFLLTGTNNLHPRAGSCNGQVEHIPHLHPAVQVVLSFQEEEPPVASEVGVVDVVLQGVTRGVTRGTLGGGCSRLHVQHLNSVKAEILTQANNHSYQ
jgi:hypothetical protein